MMDTHENTNDRAPTAGSIEAGAPSTIDLPCNADTPPNWIGRYKLLKTLGEGGMGTVYLAEQEQPIKRRVALKIIKAGMDSAQVIARFEQERQALAMMDHPNIAKVLDAGMTGPEPEAQARAGSGRPYFVMELVHGIPISKYCDQHYLTPRERLEIFVPVCQAVQHAHQKGIIHRDLKPSNVLVALYDGKPVAKIIDFGIAKATAQKLTAQTMFTEAGQIVGTLEYMSPEQADVTSSDVDTRADIYSLGVILYELLTGSPPFSAKELRGAAFTEILRLIREVEPPKPSTKLSSSDELPNIAANRKIEPKKLTKLVHGELDWIVMKCLEKERGRRYETANGLALDVQRYLADEHVTACPPSAGYRLKKFVRRNKWTLTIAACLLLAATVTAITTLVQIRAGAERDLERQHKAAHLESDIDAALREAKGLHEQAAAQREKPPQWHALLQAAFAALQRAEALLIADPDLVSGVVQARVHKLRADLDAEDKDRRMVEELDRIDLSVLPLLDKERLNFLTNERLRAYRRAFQGYGMMAMETSPGQAGAQINARPAFIAERLIVALDNWSAAKGASKDEKSWLSLVLRSADKDAWRHTMRMPGWWSAHKEAETGQVAGKSPASLVFVAKILRPYSKAHAAMMDYLRRAQQQHPGDFWLNYYLAECYATLNPPQWGEAIRFYTSAAALRPENPQVLVHLGTALVRKGEPAAAVAAFEQALHVDHSHLPALVGISDLLWDKQDKDGALAELRKAIERTKTLEAEKRFHGEAHCVLGRRLLEMNDVAAAIAAQQKAIGLGYTTIPYRHLGRALAARGDLDEAISALQTAIKLGNVTANADLGAIYFKLGRLKEAEASLLEARRDDRDDVASYFNSALVSAAQGKWQAAGASYYFAYKKDPRRANKEDFKKAIQPLESALANETENQKAFAYIAQNYLLLGDYEEAVAAGRKLVAADPTSDSHRMFLGGALVMKRDFAQAAAVYQQGADMKPTSARRSVYWAFLGDVHAASGNRTAQQQTCAYMIKQLRTTQDLNAALNVISACVYWPDTLEDMSQLMPFAKLFERTGYARPVGYVLYRTGQYEAAVKRLEEAAKSGPVDAMDHFFLAMGHLRLGNKAKAREYLQSGIKEQENMKAWQLLAGRFAIINTATGKPIDTSGRKDAGVVAAEHMRREAEALFLGIDLQELAQGGKRSFAGGNAASLIAAEEHRKLGKALSAKSNYDGAIAAYRKALDIEPHDDATHVLLGGALYGKRDYDGACAAYRQALAISPENLGAHNGLGLALLAKRDLVEALAVTQKCVDMFPLQPFAHYNLGNVWFAKADYKKAIPCFEEAISLQPKHPGPHTRLVDAYTASGDHDKSVAAARRLVEISPKLAYHHYLLGNALHNKKSLNEAIDCYRKAIDLDPKYLPARFGLGTTLKAKGKLNEAIDQYRHVVALSPKYAVAHVNLGLALLDKKDMEGAIAALHKAAELDPKNAATRGHLASAICEKGEYVAGATEFKKAIDLDPNNPWHSYCLANAQLAAGQAEAYRQICTDMLKRFEKSKNPYLANRALFASLSSTASLPDMAALIPLAEVANNGKPEIRALGAALYRNGKYAEAVTKFKQGSQGRAWDHLFLAMAHHRLGQTDMARDYLKRAVTQIRESNYPWTERVESDALRREAEELINAASNKQQ